MKSNRLSILNKQEFSDLYGLPKFTKDDRVHFFAINDDFNHIQPRYFISKSDGIKFA